ncbi:hypothetical protein BOO86_03260 [Mycobacterium sp. CBMA 234]|nr:hypothetical protein [Mycolicibacterium sp. CBMA 234]
MAWLLSITMVPIWISVHFIATMPIYSIVATIIIVLAVTVGGQHIQFTAFDAYLLAILGSASLAMDDVNQGVWAEMAVRWVIPYFAIRILAAAAGLQFTIDAISVILAIVGGLAVIELFFSWHPFVNWSVDWNAKSPEFETWHLIQSRGGTDRSTWAFGHSIALGGSLVLSIPFIARASFRIPWKVLMLAAVCAGIFTTGSRGAMMAAALTGCLTMAYLARQQAARTVAVLVATATTFLVGPQVMPVIEEWAAGSSVEEQVSATYRSYLYETYVPIIKWFGRCPDFFPGNTSLDSVDSAVLYLGVTWGWIITALIVFPLLVIVARVVTGNGSTAEIALVGQIPLFLTVGLITQYQSLVFIVVALAVQIAKGEKLELPPTPDRPDAPQNFGLTDYPPKADSAIAER